MYNTYTAATSSTFGLHRIYCLRNGGGGGSFQQIVKNATFVLLLTYCSQAEGAGGSVCCVPHCSLSLAFFVCETRVKISSDCTALAISIILFLQRQHSARHSTTHSTRTAAAAAVLLCTAHDAEALISNSKYEVIARSKQDIAILTVQASLTRGADDCDDSTEHGGLIDAWLV